LAHDHGMSETTSLFSVSNQLADAVDRAAASVVQVHGRRGPVSGVVYGSELVLTTARALGREDAVRVREPDGREIDALLYGWDPSTNLALLKTPGLQAAPAVVAASPARAGHLALAIGRSRSNAVTASFGMVAIIGGPLPTGRRLSISRVIRTTAPVHDGFAGGAFVDAEGKLVGITTAAAIRGLTVVIPADIAWAAAAQLTERGGRQRGYLGLAGQPVELPQRQRPSGHERGLLVVAVSSGGPAEAAGLLVGDVLIDFQGRAIEEPDDLLDRLGSVPVGERVSLRVVRGGALTDVTVTVGQRDKSQ